MTNAEPTKEHLWLQKLLGEWTYEHDIPDAEGQPAHKVQGTETFRPIGGLWVQGEARGPMPDGSPSVSLMTLGYDPAKERFVGTWLGSMMANLWVYEGELSADGRTLSLYCDGPSMDERNTIVPYKDVMTFISDSHRTLTGNQKQADGSWKEFMVTNYRRSS
jgi:hypothetical protein